MTVTPKTSRGLLLSDFRPRPELVTGSVAQVVPPVRVVDAHSHLGEEFGGGWNRRQARELIEELDASGVERIVDLDGGWGEEILDQRLKHFKEPYPDRFLVFGGVDWSQWAIHRGKFPEWAAGRLRAQAARGAQGLKIWKPFGLSVRDDAGQRVRVDDERLDPIWHAAGELRLPVVIHVADPAAFFRPLDCFNERYMELVAHPDWHFVGPSFPEMRQVLDEFAALVCRHDRTTFIGAHVGCYAENLLWVSRLLDRCPNFFVDIADRLDELSRQPFTAREFFTKYFDRILFGADRPVSRVMYEQCYRFLQTGDENFVGPCGEQPGVSWRLTGLNLPEDIVKHIYRENAIKILMIAD